MAAKLTRTMETALVLATTLQAAVQIRAKSEMSVAQRWDDCVPLPLWEQIQQVLPWLPLYFLKRQDRDVNASPFDNYWYYPLASSDERYLADVAPQLIALEGELQVFAELWRLIQARLDTPVRLYECEFGSNPFGCDAHPHHDSPRSDLRAQHISVIVYLNVQWEIAWAGETIVFDDEQNIACAYLPKPGRAIAIYGDPLHVGRGVSRACPVPRRVVVYKMWAT